MIPLILLYIVYAGSQAGIIMRTRNEEQKSSFLLSSIMIFLFAPVVTIGLLFGAIEEFANFWLIKEKDSGPKN